MSITFGGKTADEVASAQQQKQFQEERSAGRIKDPLTVPRNRDQQHLLGVLGDFTLWVEQLLIEMSALARKRKRLQIKLKDPELAMSSGRSAAILRYKQYGDDLVQYMNDIAALEAECDRLWQAMKTTVRKKYAMDWGTDPEEPRLIGKAWTVKATAFKWPVGYSIETVQFRRIDPYLRMELNDLMGTAPVLLGKDMEW